MHIQDGYIAAQGRKEFHVDVVRNLVRCARHPRHLALATGLVPNVVPTIAFD